MRLIDADALSARIMTDAPDFMDGGSSVTKAFILAMINTKSVTPTIYANQWIKCSEALPEERETMFAKLKGTDKWRPAMFEKMSEDVRVVEVFEDGTRRVGHSHTVDGLWDIEKKPPKRTVTHWMPNPELPAILGR